MKNLRVNVEVRFDVAAILQWVVVAAAMFLSRTSRNQTGDFEHAAPLAVRAIFG
jgi:hypothetical protein